MSAPVMLHFEETGLTLNQFKVEGSKGTTAIDYKTLHNVISNGIGIEKTKELITHYSDQALDALRYFPPSESTNALANIVYAVREV